MPRRKSDTFVYLVHEENEAKEAGRKKSQEISFKRAFCSSGFKQQSKWNAHKTQHRGEEDKRDEFLRTALWFGPAARRKSNKTLKYHYFFLKLETICCRKCFSSREEGERIYDVEL